MDHQDVRLCSVLLSELLESGVTNSLINRAQSHRGDQLCQVEGYRDPIFIRGFLPIRAGRLAVDLSYSGQDWRQQGRSRRYSGVCGSETGVRIGQDIERGREL